MHEDLNNKAALREEVDNLYARVDIRLERLSKMRPLPVERIAKGEAIKNDLIKLRRHFFTKDEVGILNMWIKRLNDNGVYLKTPLE